jgi:hypothetical protein
MTSNPDGLQPILMRSIAKNSPDVHALLLVIADSLSLGQSQGDELQVWRKAILSLATRLHWCSINQHAAIQQVYAALLLDFSPASINKTLEASAKAGLICRLVSPEDLDAFTTLPASDLAGWTWWKFIHEDGDPSGNERRQAIWGKLLDIRGNRELLLYAQRHYLARRFSDFNPVERDFCEEYDLPWEFDHILALAHVRAKKDRKYQKFVCEWIDTIGNLRAVPFADNRSDCSEMAASKITTTEEMESGFLLSEELPGFSIEHVLDSETAAASFAQTCQTRMVRIYAEWFKHLS